MPRWNRITDICWVIQPSVTGQPTEIGGSRFLADRWLFRDAPGVFNPRHSYTENEFDLDVTIPTGFTRLAHDFEIADGIEVTIEDGAELLVL